MVDASNASSGASRQLRYMHRLKARAAQAGAQDAAVAALTDRVAALESEKSVLIAALGLPPASRRALVLVCEKIGLVARESKNAQANDKPARGR
jgi:hypothetical protein